MRSLVIGTFACAGLVFAAAGALGQRGEAPSSRPAVLQGGELVAVATTVGNQYQQVTVIDPSVYHVELTSGKITLRSVRNLRWDLQMTELNTNHPLPQELQSLFGSQ